MHFQNDEARDLLITMDMKESIKASGWWLGPTSSVGSFALGPFFYYLLFGVNVITGFNPVAGSFMVALFGIATIGMFYWVGKMYFGRLVGFLSAFGYTFSFLMIRFDRFAWNPNVFTFFLLLWLAVLGKLLFSKKQIDNKQSRWLWLIALLSGLLAQLHATGFIFVPLLIIILLIARVKIKPLRRIWESIGIFIVSFLPIIIFDILHKAQNLLGMGKAIFKLSGGEFISIVDRIGSTYEQIINFVSEAFVVKGSNWAAALMVVLMIAALVLMAWRANRSKDNWLQKRKAIIFISWTIIYLGAYLLFSGTLYLHYFVPWYALVWILVPVGITFAVSGLVSRNNWFSRLGAFWIIVFYVAIILIPNLTAYRAYIKDGFQGEQNYFYSEESTLGAFNAAKEYITTDARERAYTVEILPAEKYNNVERALFNPAEASQKATLEYTIIVSNSEIKSEVPAGKLLDTIQGLEIYRK
ncbi:ArnT family glycosyltransferase [Patescibacteria group bacterium]